MTTAIVPTEATEVSSIRTATETELEAAEQAAETARADWTSWGERRAGQEARARAIAAELAETVTKLAQARKATLSGQDDPKAVAELAARRHTLEASRDEVAELVALARAEEAAARATWEPLAAIADQLSIREQGERRVAAAAALDELIDTEIGRLFELMERRAQLIGDGRGGLPVLPVNWAAMPHIRDPHGHLTLPNV